MTYREASGFSVAKLSRDSDVSRKTITDIEAGEANATIDNILAIAGALGLDLDEFLTVPTGDLRVPAKYRGRIHDVIRGYMQVRQVDLNIIAAAIGRTREEAEKVLSNKEELSLRETSQVAKKLDVKLSDLFGLP